MRSIALVTSSRADWGIQRTVAEALRNRTDVELRIVACGMHVEPAFGRTVEQIRADGFTVACEMPPIGAPSTGHGAALAIAEGTRQFAEYLDRNRPDLVTVLGDRFDMLPAALAATPLLIPIAHLHGGELTYGAFDDALRHAMTKLAHIHLAATDEYARRIRQMGEPPEHVHVVGAPGIDDIVREGSKLDFARTTELGFEAGATNFLVVYHPETRAAGRLETEAAALFAVLRELDGPMVIVRPNADPGNAIIQERIDELCRTRPKTRAVVSLDRLTFLALLRHCSVLIGNSSSGIIEAPSFGVPVVNIGDRQAGRIRGRNVLDCPCAPSAIEAAVRKALSPDFRAGLAGAPNPYGDGQSGRRIAEILASTPLDDRLLRKRFVDVEFRETRTLE
jgi:UDP-hydrolysing UDP-N-acetyl-D-glucosamine 2-epimerase